MPLPSSSDRVTVLRETPELGLVETLRASVAGQAAVKVAFAASTLFEAGGRRVLAPATQAALRRLAERGAQRAIATVTTPLLDGAAALAPGASAASTATRTISVQVARSAAREVMKGAGRAAALGFVVDGAFAGVEAVIAVRSGNTDRASAVRHVAKEAASGAVATGAGVLVGAGLVALTGGLAAPVVFAASAAGAIGVKRVVRRWMG
jgi:hypothetical protein